MPKLANMIGDTGTIEIAVPNDEPLVVVYRRGAVTPRMQGKLGDIQKRLKEQGDDAMTGSEDIRTFCELMAGMVTSWNLTDADGAVIATDAESLSDVAFSTLNMVMEEIGRQSSADPLSDGGSSNGSSRTASLAPRLITTAS